MLGGFNADCLKFWEWPKECPHSEMWDGAHMDKTRYVYSEKSVTTSDGYILTVFRVGLTPELQAKLSDKRKANLKRPAILMHGMAGHPYQWISNTAKTSVGYYMVEQGFDVWLPGPRGFEYSRGHTNKNIKKSDYFNYSWAESGLYDVPAIYKMIQDLYKNPNQKIIYMAHSRGTTMFFVSLLDPTTTEYISKNTERFFAFAPIVYLTHIGNKAAQIFSPLQGLAVPLATLIKADWVCGDGCGKNPSGSCVHDALHFGQQIDGTGPPWDRKPIFRKFDWGLGNLFVYKQLSPPEWDLGKYPKSVPTTMQTNEKDDMSTPENVKELRKNIGKKDYDYEQIPGWGHNNIFGGDDKTQLYAIIDRGLGLDPIKF